MSSLRHARPHTYVRIVALVVLTFAIGGWLPSGTVHAGDNGDSTLTFDGTNDNVTATLDGTTLTALAVEMWIYPIVSASKGIFQWARSGVPNDSNPFVYFFYNSGNFQLYVNGDYRITTALPVGRWTHIAASYTAPNWTLYKNGVSVGTYGGGASNNQPNGNVLYLGTGFHGYWNGQIDEARIWTVGRSQAQVQAAMYSELSGPIAGLAASYHLNDGAGSGTAADSSGNTRTGTLNNMNTATAWSTSTAPIADATLATQNALAGIWLGKTTGTSSGLTVTNNTFLQDIGDDVIFGHDGATLQTNADLPTAPPWNTAPNPNRFVRTWYCDLNDQGANGGTLDLTFTSTAAPSGPPSNYRLLERAGTTGTFTDLGGATSINSVAKTITFSGVSSANVCSFITLGSLNNTLSPTPVTVTAFTVQADGTGTTLHWSTASEIGLQGFQVLRSATGSRADAMSLPGAFVAAAGDGTTGSTYSWRDPASTKGAAYWIIARNTDGTSSEYGPATSASGPATIITSLYLPLVQR